MKLTEHEAEFVTEMNVEPRGADGWTHFDPPFQRKAYQRFVRKGWLEYRNDNRHREFRWTPTGRVALQEVQE